MSDGGEFVWGAVLVGCGIFVCVYGNVLFRFVLAVIGFAVGFAAAYTLTDGQDDALRILVSLVVGRDRGGRAVHADPGRALHRGRHPRGRARHRRLLALRPPGLRVRLGAAGADRRGGRGVRLLRPPARRPDHRPGDGGRGASWSSTASPSSTSTSSRPTSRIRGPRSPSRCRS